MSSVTRKKRKPCRTCPFRKETVFDLGLERLNEILDSFLKNNAVFTCHKYTEEPTKHPCIGSLILLKGEQGSIYENNMNRINARIGYLTEEDIDFNTPNVCLTRQEFIDCNS